MELGNEELVALRQTYFTSYWEVKGVWYSGSTAPPMNASHCRVLLVLRSKALI